MHIIITSIFVGYVEKTMGNNQNSRNFRQIFLVTCTLECTLHWLQNFLAKAIALIIVHYIPLQIVKNNLKFILSVYLIKWDVLRKLENALRLLRIFTWSWNNGFLGKVHNTSGSIWTPNNNNQYVQCTNIQTSSGQQICTSKQIVGKTTSWHLTGFLQSGN